MDKHVMVFAESVEGKLSPVSKEVLGGGRQLADALGEELHALFIGEGLAAVASEACAFGADTTYVVENPKFAQYEIEVYVKILASIVEQKKPRILLFGHTDAGADLGPRLAFRLKVGIATDCVDVSIEPDTTKLLRTKPVYGGMAMATFTSEDFPQMATVRPKSLPPAERRSSAQGAIIPLDVDPGPVSPRVHFLKRVIEEVQGIKLEDADVIVSGGRGIGGAEGFQELEKLAKLLKGTVGASRVACDSGWAASTLQVGLTGKIVAPKLYVAVGISGASQHMTGCSRSQRIVAINKDPAAPIFKQAHFGVAGDWKVVLPTLMEKLKSLE